MIMFRDVEVKGNTQNKDVYGFTAYIRERDTNIVFKKRTFTTKVGGKVLGVNNRLRIKLAKWVFGLRIANEISKEEHYLQVTQSNKFETPDRLFKWLRKEGINVLLREDLDKLEDKLKVSIIE